MLAGTWRYCSGERGYRRQAPRRGLPRAATRGRPGALPLLVKGKGLTTVASSSRGRPMPDTGCHTPVPGDSGGRGQRSVTLFSSAAAICWRRKASCIFWAAGSSSRALMI